MTRKPHTSRKPKRPTRMMPMRHLFFMFNSPFSFFDHLVHLRLFHMFCAFTLSLFIGDIPQIKDSDTLNQKRAPATAYKSAVTSTLFITTFPNILCCFKVLSSQVSAIILLSMGLSIPRVSMNPCPCSYYDVPRTILFDSTDIFHYIDDREIADFT